MIRGYKRICSRFNGVKLDSISRSSEGGSGVVGNGAQEAGRQAGRPLPTRDAKGWFMSNSLSH